MGKYGKMIRRENIRESIEENKKIGVPEDLPKGCRINPKRRPKKAGLRPIGTNLEKGISNDDKAGTAKVIPNNTKQKGGETVVVIPSYGSLAYGDKFQVVTSKGKSPVLIKVEPVRYEDHKESDTYNFQNKEGTIKGWLPNSVEVVCVQKE